MSAFLGVFLLAGNAAAASLSFDGPLTQGGLVVGKTEPGARVSIDGRPVRVSSEGAFLMGFGRDAEKTVHLRLDHPDGTRTEKTLSVKGRAYKVQRIDGLPEQQVTPRTPEDLARIRDDNAKIATVRNLDTAKAWFASGFQWPVIGPLSGVFGSQRILNGEPRRPHNGVDVAAPRGTTVTAAADGVVVLVHPDMFYTGKTVMIDHGHGLSSVYVHMDDILIADGQRISQGTPIGIVGKTGRVTGAHLHWGVSLFGTLLDPALLAGPMNLPAAQKKGG
ncbi:MAG: M23 family metallopeptidase [Proteobacteria bacterium]|nr:M23 family metallopeptidase [Pseudomonadota bacterium]